MVSDLGAGLRELGPIGFVGLGNMGSPMVARLLAAGAEVQAFDTSADALDRALAGEPLAPRTCPAWPIDARSSC